MAIASGYRRVGTARVARPIYRLCYVKQRWTDPWIMVPFLDCLMAEERAAPGIGSARFRYHYGWIKREGYPYYAGFYPLNIGGWYIGVGVSVIAGFERSQVLWVGVADYEHHAPHGTTGWLQGPQEINAFALEHLFDRIQIRGAYTENGYVERALRFNVRDGRGLTVKGNRSAERGPAGAYVFGQAGEEWSSQDILEYLLAYYAPAGMMFTLGGALNVLRNVKEQWDFNGQTVFQAINALVDRNRGLGWRLRTWNGEGVINLDVFTGLQEPISVGAYTVPANAEQMVVSFDGRIDGQPEIVVNRLATYERLEVRGGSVYSTFSLSFADETLTEGWTESLETAYKGGSTAEDAGAEDHDAERSTDKFKSVYQDFKVPDDWDWEAGDGEGGDKYPVVPVVLDDGTVVQTTKGVYYTPGHTFERELCIRANDPELVEEADPRFQTAFVVVKQSEPGVDEDPEDEIEPDPVVTWHYVDKLSAIELTPASVRVEDKGLVIRVEPRLNHIAAKNHFNSDSNAESEYDYRDYIATVQVETDARLVIRATLPGMPQTETGRTKVIEYPGAVYWQILPGTVLDITDGELVRAENWRVERDDTPTLRAVAALAAAWYLVPRSNLAFQKMGVGLAHPVGQLIRGLAANWSYTNVGSVVTRRAWDFTGPIPVTSWQTGWEDLNAVTTIGDASEAVMKRRAAQGKTKA